MQRKVADKLSNIFGIDKLAFLSNDFKIDLPPYIICMIRRRPVKKVSFDLDEYLYKDILSRKWILDKIKK